MAHLQLAQGLISQEVHDLHFSILSALDLPVTYPQGDWLELKALMSMDKKARGNTLRFVTITQPGTCDRLEGVADSKLLEAYGKVSL
jgi:3-dehydroquinate synthase